MASAAGPVLPRDRGAEGTVCGRPGLRLAGCPPMSVGAKRSGLLCGGGRRRLVLGVLPGASRGGGLGTWGNAWLGPGYPLGPGWGRAWMVGENGANRPGPLVIGSRLFLLTGRWHVPWLVVFPEVAGHDFRVVGGAERGFCAVVHDIDEEQAAVGHLHFVPCMGTGEWF